jgi:hypothetical protein
MLGFEQGNSLTWWLILLLSVIFILAGNGVSWWQAPGIKALRERVADLEDTLQRTQQDYLDLARQTEQNYFELFKHQLSLLANTELHFADTERISVYKHDGEAFVMLGRYSKNPDYDKRGRGLYPDDEGVIGHAWHHGEAADDDLPDFVVVPDDYLEYTRNHWGITEEITRNFTMKSRTYAAFALEHPVRLERVAVVVFESTKVGKLTVDTLRRALETTEGKRIYQFLDMMQSIEPTPSYARSEGF